MLNEARLMGHLGQAPELKRTAGGQRYAMLSLATSERWKDKTRGEQRERTEWHRIVVWSEPILDFVEKNLSKGSKVYVEGRIASRRWKDDKGIDRYTTEIVLQGFRARLVGLDRAKGDRVPEPEGEDDWGREREPADA